MSDLLSGLGSLGLGSLQGMELFEEDKHEDATKKTVEEVKNELLEFLGGVR